MDIHFPLHRANCSLFISTLQCKTQSLSSDKSSIQIIVWLEHKSHISKKLNASGVQIREKETIKLEGSRWMHEDDGMAFLTNLKGWVRIYGQERAFPTKEKDLIKATKSGSGRISVSTQVPFIAWNSNCICPS